jgi:hypothetical protein
MPSSRVATTGLCVRSEGQGGAPSRGRPSGRALSGFSRS